MVTRALLALSSAAILTLGGVFVTPTLAKQDCDKVLDKLALAIEKDHRQQALHFLHEAQGISCDIPAAIQQDLAHRFNIEIDGI